MPARTLHLALLGPESTATLARRIGAVLCAGDVLLLDGPVGAGKTHFARSLIQSLLPTPEDVPSPTFTLVQTYEAPAFDIWHTDLYRLSAPEEVIELGLLGAFEHSVTLVEWPDRLGALAPTDALSLTFAPHDDPDQRVLDITWHDPRWDGRAGEFSG
ncbi:tRNA threonylcarbamoyladenosine biosynthesis protein TsaE [Roseovarius sp. THAF9]|uniref:tRNA (adenosine(37)-N6)-threonylcarbamoyltransferase complex ATPase subunit type 1 TsaE n=1 Tax=Roseovarius sp. THAF9 TaxID=2587847 RepID=UPI001267D5A7|nr:tRNA (adenosine(37)-N6)-threonylcarbamoyltransferase complex ATPase subunit type 1 TsaE [Roseovarius sp. THAF9]QFT94954.1 tRNA threonylcarbamoyladenosine biosynthesis protein TsaE [Roseovarius sp. THAF9]